MSDMQTRQLAVTDISAYIEGSCASQDSGARVPYCVAYDLADGRIAAMRGYGEIASFMPPSQGAGCEAPVEWASSRDVRVVTGSITQPARCLCRTSASAGSSPPTVWHRLLSLREDGLTHGDSRAAT